MTTWKKPPCVRAGEFTFGRAMPNRSRCLSHLFQRVSLLVLALADPFRHVACSPLSDTRIEGASCECQRHPPQPRAARRRSRREAARDPARAGPQGRGQRQGRRQASEKQEPVQAGAREQPGRAAGAAPREARPRGGDGAEAAFLAPGLRGQQQAARHGGADHRRRLRHRPRGGGAVRARRRRRGDRLPETSTTTPRKPSAASRPKAGAAC